jgi:hypothetical protein
LRSGKATENIFTIIYDSNTIIIKTNTIFAELYKTRRVEELCKFNENKQCKNRAQ